MAYIAFTTYRKLYIHRLLILVIVNNPRTTATTNNQEAEVIPEAWCHHQPPQGEQRIDVPVTLIMDKPLYQRFMTLIQQDPVIFAQVASDIMNSNLENWAGTRLSSGCPEALLEYVEAALNKHHPLLKDEEKAGKEGEEADQ